MLSAIQSFLTAHQVQLNEPHWINWFKTCFDNINNKLTIYGGHGDLEVSRAWQPGGPRFESRLGQIDFWTSFLAAFWIVNCGRVVLHQVPIEQDERRKNRTSSDNNVITSCEKEMIYKNKK